MDNLPNFDLENFDVEEIPRPVSTNDRSLARRIALQVLYEVDSVRHPVGEVLMRRIESQSPERKVVGYLRKLVSGVLSYRDELDKAIQHHAPEFPLAQIAIVDRNILRLAVLELGILQSTPIGVAIDQAIELTELFGSESSPRFINGVLGALVNDEALLKALPKIEDGTEGSKEEESD